MVIRQAIHVKNQQHYTIVYYYHIWWIRVLHNSRRIIQTKNVWINNCDYFLIITSPWIVQLMHPTTTIHLSLWVNNGVLYSSSCLMHRWIRQTEIISFVQCVIAVTILRSTRCFKQIAFRPVVPLSTRFLNARNGLGTHIVGGSIPVA